MKLKRKPMKEPQAASQILADLFQKRGFNKKIRQYSLFEIWTEVVGERIARETVPQKMMGDTLLVATKSAAWAQELSFMKTDILSKIRHSLPDADIKDIRFTSGRYNRLT